MPERRKINLPMSKDEFKSLPDMDEKLWKIVELFSGQVHHCSGRFNVIEKKIGFFRIAIIAVVFYLIGVGVVKSGVIIKWLTKII